MALRTTAGIALLLAPLWSQSATITINGATISAWVETDVSSPSPRKVISFMNSGQKPVEVAWALHGTDNVSSPGKGRATVRPLPRKQGLVILSPIDRNKPMDVATITLSVPEREH